MDFSIWSPSPSSTLTPSSPFFYLTFKFTFFTLPFSLSFFHLCISLLHPSSMQTLTSLILLISFLLTLSEHISQVFFFFAINIVSASPAFMFPFPTFITGSTFSSSIFYLPLCLNLLYSSDFLLVRIGNDTCVTPLPPPPVLILPLISFKAIYLFYF